MCRQLLCFALIFITAGCSSRAPAELLLPAYDAAASAQAALDQYDKNKNGYIDGTELDACPALRIALAAIDKNNDRRVSAGELKERIDQYAARTQIPVTVTLTLDEQPLAGATVVFEPEPFLAAALKTLTATTDKDGVASSFQQDGKAISALPAGLYRIRITKDGARIPPRYNSQSILGREIFGVSRQGEFTLEIAMTSR